MNVLIACEESQRVCTEFRKLGHNAFSCDIIPCSGGHPEWHIMQDVLPLLNGRCSFKTMDGIEHSIDGKWDLIIAHPPCTYLTLAGNKWFKPEFADRFPNRKKQRKEAIDFFMAIANADCDKIAIENPVGIMSSQWRKPDQYIEPYMFGDSEKEKNGYLAQAIAVAETNKHCRTGYYSLQIRRKRAEMAHGDYALAKRRKKPFAVTDIYRHSKSHGEAMGRR